MVRGLANKQLDIEYLLAKASADWPLQSLRREYFEHNRSLARARSG